MSKRLISIPEFARIVGISGPTARAMVRNGDVPTVRIRTRHRIDSEWLKTWLAGKNEPEQVQPSQQG